MDIAIVTLLIYSVLVWFKQTKAVFVAVGMFILAGVYLLARGLNLVLTAYIFQGFFAVFLIALVVIFQEELRHFFERIAVWSLGGKTPSPMQSYEVEALVRAIGEMGRDKVGALIVLRGRDPIERHLSGGVPLDGRISETLLRSIFDPHSDGHDGAVIIDKNRVERFGTLLPLSKELEKLGRMGTRHSAALGMAELTDALSIVVSEEKGTVSVAEEGEIREVDLDALHARIERFLKDSGPTTVNGGWDLFWQTNLREKLAALLLSIGFWFLFAEGSQTVRREYVVSISPHNVPASLEVKDIQPETVLATLAGLRRDFYLLDPARLRVQLDLSGAEPGPRGYIITEQDFVLPADLSLVRLEPPAVTVRLSPRAGAPEPARP